MIYLLLLFRAIIIFHFSFYHTVSSLVRYNFSESFGVSVTLPSVLFPSGKATDDLREVTGGESAPTEDGDGDGDAGDLKR